MVNIKINRIDTKNIKGNELDIICFGDWHIGDKCCNLDKIKKQIEWIKNNKTKVRVILMGDLLNTALKDSVGAGPWEQNMEPQEQIDMALELLEPIKDTLIGAHIGNHELRVYNDTSINIIKNLCKALNIPYLDSGALHHIRFGKSTYIIYSTHGTSCSTTPQGKLGACMKLQQVAKADVYCMGHVHDLITYAQDYMDVDLKDKTLRRTKKYFVTTGHFLNYGGYAEQKNYAPSKTGVAKIKLFANKWDIHISI